MFLEIPPNATFTIRSTEERWASNDITSVTSREFKMRPGNEVVRKSSTNSLWYLSWDTLLSQSESGDDELAAITTVINYGLDTIMPKCSFVPLVKS